MKDYSKFKPYKTVFAVFFTMASLSWISGYILESRCEEFSRVTRFLSSLPYMTADPFTAGIVAELGIVLMIFIAGPTIYAPAGSLAALMLYAVLSGADTAASASSALVTAVEGVLWAVSCYLVTVYASFCTMTGLTAFSAEGKPDGMFTGAIFNTRRFRGIFNIRFIAAYIAAFILFSLFFAASAALRRFIT